MNYAFCSTSFDGNKPNDDSGDFTITSVSKQSPPNGELNLIAKSKEQELLRLKAIIQAIGFNPTVFDQLVIKCQEMEQKLRDRDQLCQALKRRIVSLEAQVSDLHCAGFRKEVTPSNREILDLTQQIRQLSYELKSKDEYIGQLHAECQLKDENLELVKRQLVCKESL